MWWGTHGVALAITEGLKAESALVSLGPVAGGWPGEAGPLDSRGDPGGALSGEGGTLGLVQALRVGWLPGVVDRAEDLSYAVSPPNAPVAHRSSAQGASRIVPGQGLCEATAGALARSLVRADHARGGVLRLGWRGAPCDVPSLRRWAAALMVWVAPVRVQEDSFAVMEGCRKVSGQRWKGVAAVHSQLL